MTLRAAAAGVALSALALAAAACAPAGAADRTVEVTIRHSRFVPADFTFTEGSTVRFVVRNTDPIDHEFLIGDQAAQDAHEYGTEPSHGARPGEISISAGTSSETTFTFGQVGTLLVGCHLPGHWDYGMRGSIEVR
jgi:uncharacterized cupredoxin-like copper-binding protein